MIYLLQMHIRRQRKRLIPVTCPPLHIRLAAHVKMQYATIHNIAVFDEIMRERLAV